MRPHKASRITRKLTKSFLSSSFIPFLCIVALSAFITNRSYQHDILDLTGGYLKSLSVAINQYLKDIEQVALLPYFNDAIFNDLKSYSEQGAVKYIESQDLSDRLDQLLSSVRYTRGDFYAGLIVSGDKVLYESSNYTYDVAKKPYDWSKESWYQLAMEDPNNFRFLPPHKPSYYGGRSDTEVISIVGTIRKLKENIPFAVIKLDLLPSSFDYYLEDVRFHVPSIITITDRQGVEVYWKERGIKAHPGLDDPHYLHVFCSVPDTEYTLHVLLDRKAISWKSRSIYLIGIFFYLLALCISTLLNLQFSQRISRPIEEIKRVLEAAGNGNLSARFHSHSWWELQEIGNSINEMLSRLEKTIEHTYIAELKRGEAERRALQSQIQPHFLFNTLDSLIALLYEGKYELLEESLYSLSSMLRYVLAKSNLVTLKEEASFLCDYLLLLHNRFPDRMEWHVTIAPSVHNAVIPRLLLQPFVENSIIHGMEPRPEKTTISVDASLVGEDVIIRIEDDGAGFDSDKIDITKGVGISNCLKRLKLVSKKSTLSISSKIGEGCKVLITFPLEVTYEDSHS